MNTEIKLGTISGPHISKYRGDKQTWQYLVRGHDGWELMPEAATEPEARQMAQAYADKVLGVMSPGARSIELVDALMTASMLPTYTELADALGAGYDRLKVLADIEQASGLDLQAMHAADALLARLPKAQTRPVGASEDKAKLSELATPAERDAAAAIHATDTLTFDDEPRVSRVGDGGYWVEAWAFVPEVK